MKLLFQISIVAFFSVCFIGGNTHNALANYAPQAIPKFSIDGAPASSFVTVTLGKPVHLVIDNSASRDADGWNSVGTGVAQGGSCNINTEFLQGHNSFPFNKNVDNPASPSSCNVDMGIVTFNDKNWNGTTDHSYNILRIDDAAGAHSYVASVTVRVIDSHQPVARVRLSIDGAPFSNNVAVYDGVPFHLRADASESNDPDGWTTAGIGVSKGGKCEWNTEVNQNKSVVFDETISNPSSPGACNVDLGMHTFYQQSGVNINTYNLLRITDASGNFSELGKVNISVAKKPVNQSPVANVRWKIGNRTPSSLITVTRGMPVIIDVVGDLSTDPDGWNDSVSGVSQGGKCEWNTDFDRSASTTYEVISPNPAGPVICRITLPPKTFNDVPGTYTYNLLRITDRQNGVSNIGTASVTIVAPVNNSPIAVAQVKVDSSVYGPEQAVTQGVPAHIYLGADLSSDPNGWTTASTGVSQGGKCEWNADLNLGTTTYERTIANPNSPALCNIDLGMKTFNNPPGRYVYPVLRITDSASGVSNVASVTVVVVAKEINLAPVAVAKFSVNSAPPLSHIYVTRGVPVRIGLDASSSYDPNGWTAPSTGMSVGGKCFWNTNLDQSKPVPFTKTIINPAMPSACNVDLGTLTFNDPQGTYTYALLKLTDAKGLQSIVAYADKATNGLFARIFPSAYAQSANGSAIVTVVDGPTPSPSPTPTCNPFRYNTDCPPPTPTPTPSPTPSPSPTPCIPGEECVTPRPSPDLCPPGETCTIGKIIVNSISDKVDVIKNGITDLLASILGGTPEDISKFITEKSRSIATALASIALALSAPVLVSNLLPQLANWVRFFGSFFTVHKRKERWGIVVDSDLGRPIAQTVVQIFDGAFHQLKETQVTGVDGQFGFLLPVGKYYVVANEPGFAFPAHKKPPIVLREGERIYLGEEFEITEENTNNIPHLIVPMDREEAVPVGNAIIRQYWDRFIEAVDRIGFVFLFIGAAINTYLLMLVPGKLNLFFELLYLLLLILKLYILLSHQRGIGSVIDRVSRKYLDLSIIRLYDSITNRIVQTKVTNRDGRFFILAPKGEYTASVSKPGYKTLLISKLHIKSSSSKAIAINFAIEKMELTK